MGPTLWCMKVCAVKIANHSLLFLVLPNKHLEIKTKTKKTIMASYFLFIQTDTKAQVLILFYIKATKSNEINTQYLTKNVCNFIRWPSLLCMHPLLYITYFHIIKLTNGPKLTSKLFEVSRILLTVSVLYLRSAKLWWNFHFLSINMKAYF